MRGGGGTKNRGWGGGGGDVSRDRGNRAGREAGVGGG